MKFLDYNLLISTGRNFEDQAECELWFNLMRFGDEQPIIKKTYIPGLLLAKTTLNYKQFIKSLKDFLTNEENKGYFQYIKKIIPLDLIVPTTVEFIVQSTLMLIKGHPLGNDKQKSFRITINKRRTQIHTSELITPIARALENPVDLKNYDWNIQIEIIGELTGIAILKEEDIFKPLKEKKNVQ